MITYADRQDLRNYINDKYIISIDEKSSGAVDRILKDVNLFIDDALRSGGFEVPDDQLKSTNAFPLLKRINAVMTCYEAVGKLGIIISISKEHKMSFLQKLYDQAVSDLVSIRDGKLDPLTSQGYNINKNLFVLKSDAQQMTDEKLAGL